MLRRFPSLASQHLSKRIAVRTMSSSPDYYVAVAADGQLAAPSPSTSAAASALPDLWKGSRAKETAGETRTFYNVDGKTVVAVGTGKAKERKGGEAEENALKEQTRRTASRSSWLRGTMY